MLLHTSLQVLCKEMPARYRFENGVIFWTPDDSHFDECPIANLAFGRIEPDIALSTCFLLEWLFDRHMIVRIFPRGKFTKMIELNREKKQVIGSGDLHAVVHAAAVMVLQDPPPWFLPIHSPQWCLPRDLSQ